MPSASVRNALSGVLVLTDSLDEEAPDQKPLRDYDGELSACQPTERFCPDLKSGIHWVIVARRPRRTPDGKGLIFMRPKHDP